MESIKWALNNPGRTVILRHELNVSDNMKGEQCKDCLRVLPCGWANNPDLQARDGQCLMFVPCACSGREPDEKNKSRLTQIDILKKLIDGLNIVQDVTSEEKEAMRDLMNDDTKPTFEGNKIKQDVKDHTKHFLQFPDILGYVVVSGSVDLDRLKEVNDAGLLNPCEFPVLQDIISSIERKCKPQGITSDAMRLDNIQHLPTPGMLGFLADFLNNEPFQVVIEKEEDKEDSLAKLYFMITGVDGEKHFKLIGSKNLKHEKQLPRAYTSGYPVMYLFGLHSEYLRLIDDKGVSHTFRLDESILDEGRLGWAVNTAKAAGDRLTLINRKIKKFNETLEGKIIEVEI